MYSIKLDENKFFTGSYAKVGTVQGGINIPTLPPTDNINKAKCYKYDYYDITTVSQQPKTEIVIITDENTGEETEVTQVVVDENGDVIFENVSTTTRKLGWFFDEEKYQLVLAEELEINRQNKIQELSNMCETIILFGLDIETSKGVEHFSLELTDQLEIMNQYNNVLKGAIEVPYHADNKPCRMFSSDEMTKIALESTAFVVYNRTYFNYIKEVIKRCVTNEDINSVVWGTPLPEDLNKLFTQITGISTIVE